MNAEIGPKSEERLGTDDDTSAAVTRRGRGRPVREAPQDVPDERVAGERDYEDRETTMDRELSDDERLELFRDSLFQSVLPDLPSMPGYHVCWLTTSNGRDTITRRKQLGYELLRHEDVPGWVGGGQGGEFAGCIMVNEMVAARIKLSLYNRFMRVVHDELPRGEEEKLRAQIERVREKGMLVEEGDGTAVEIATRAEPMPDFLS